VEWENGQADGGTPKQPGAMYSQVRRGRRLMADRLYPWDDFEATVRAYGAAEGGRRTAAFNGIRWDFAYADGQLPDTLYMIWPDFYAADGRSLPTDQPLPIGVELSARMVVVTDEMRAEVHRRRIARGVCFFCHEGGRRVGEGVVTRVTGLFAPRKQPAREHKRGRVYF
jgi:translation elongation factor EF-Tu-like GTPase